MLKGKKGLYILLPLVIIIWGVIIYKIVDAFSEKETATMNMAIVKPMKLASLQREKFDIGTVDRDPFLGTIYRPVVKKRPQKTISRKKKDTLIWPNILYKGLVTDKATGKAVYVLEINGVAQLLKQKQSASEITLLKGSAKKVTIGFKGKRKQVNISN